MWNANQIAETSASGLLPIGRRQEAVASNVSRPLVVEPSQYFEGNDGSWSTFYLRVGTPEEHVRVLISTSSHHAMVVLPEGCSPEVIRDSLPNCVQSRGQLFSPNVSSTWQDQSTFRINNNGVGFGASLGYSQVARFGIDTLGLGLVGPTLHNQTIAAFVHASPFYLGVFGLGTEPVNYSTMGNMSAPNFITTLRDRKLIPSISWSYTAGASYRLRKVLGQLIFGGYDSARIIPNNVSFTLAQDQDRDIVAAVQQITVSGVNQTKLLPNPIYAFIDSTDPMIWLPESACTAFEMAFSLRLDEASNRYLVNESHHASLVAMNPLVTFRLSSTLSGGQVVNINMPYSAFDLEVSYPIVANKSRYFPLMKAANDTQYTLGRTFLQEAYVSVNHEFNNFSVSQCAWTEEALNPGIVALPSRDTTNGVPSSSTTSTQDHGTHSLTTHGLASGTIAGIAMAALFGATCFALALWFSVFHPRQKAKAQAREQESAYKDKDSIESLGSLEFAINTDGGLFEVPGVVAELASGEQFPELSDQGIIAELEFPTVDVDNPAILWQVWQSLPPYELES